MISSCWEPQVSRLRPHHLTECIPTRLIPSTGEIGPVAGFTGRLITRYLYSHPQRSSFSFALGVRSKAKGEALKRSLGLDDSVQLVQVDVTRYEDVEAAVKEAKVVINAVGPYWRWGTNVVR